MNLFEGAVQKIRIICTSLQLNKENLKIIGEKKIKTG